MSIPQRRSAARASCFRNGLASFALVATLSACTYCCAKPPNVFSQVRSDVTFANVPIYATFDLTVSSHDDNAVVSRLARMHLIRIHRLSRDVSRIALTRAGIADSRRRHWLFNNDQGEQSWRFPIGRRSFEYVDNVVCIGHNRATADVTYRIVYNAIGQALVREVAAYHERLDIIDPYQEPSKAYRTFSTRADATQSLTRTLLLNCSRNPSRVSLCVKMGWYR